MSGKPKNHSCPECGSKGWIPIVYGYPSTELMEEIERGEVVSGGCCVDVEGNDPNWQCKQCGHQILWP